MRSKAVRVRKGSGRGALVYGVCLAIVASLAATRAEANERPRLWPSKSALRGAGHGRPQRRVGSIARERTLDALVRINRSALAAYDRRQFDRARELLRDALKLCERARLEQHPVAARTRVHLGAVIIVGYGRPELGMNQFRKALQIQPDIALTPAIATPDLRQAFAQAAGPGPDASAIGYASSDPDASVVRSARPDEEEAEDTGASRFFAAVSIGGGYGLARGTGEADPAHRLTGMVPAPAQLGHLAPELGYFLRPDLLLSIQGRIQYVNNINAPAADPGETYRAPSTTAYAAFARATWLFGESRLRWLAGAAVGVGRIRHAREIWTDGPCGPQSGETCVDTYTMGPILVGPTLGLSYRLSDSVSLLAGLNGQVGLPTLGLNVDANAGLVLTL